EVLTPSSVVFFFEPLPKGALLRVLLDSLVRPGEKLSGEEMLRRLLRREQEGSTFLTEGIALPHVRLPELEQPRVALGLLRAGLVPEPADVLDRVACEQVFLFLCPDRHPEGCLQLLAVAARMYRDMPTRLLLGNAVSADRVLAAIREWEAESAPR
nr:PTS sugar transporter subunit IIA [Acidobacteriota bacterium]